MTRSGIEQLLYMMDRAFDADTSFGTWHASCQLGDVRDETGSGARRRQAVDLRYRAARGRGQVRLRQLCVRRRLRHWQHGGAIPTIEATTPRQDVAAWLTEGQQRLRDHVAALTDDSELLAMRPDIWGTQHETRWLVTQVIQHDLYHAGELNHIRALRHQNDEWGNEP